VRSTAQSLPDGYNEGMNLIGLPIAVIGFGYVGLPVAVEFEKRFPVTGFDIKPERIAALIGSRPRGDAVIIASG